MKHDSNERVFRQKAVYRYFFPALTCLLLVAALVTTYLILTGNDTGFVRNACFWSWLCLLVFVRPAYAVFSFIVVTSDSITIQGPFGLRTIWFWDVTGLDIQRPRQRVLVRSPNVEIYCGPSFRDIDELIDVLEESIRPYLREQAPPQTQALGDTRPSELPRTFRRNKRFRMRTYLGVAMLVIPAAFLTLHVSRSFSMISLAMAAVFWLLSIFTIRDLLRLPSKLIVDENAITYTGLFGTTRIPYDQVVEITVTLRSSLTSSLTVPYRHLVKPVLGKKYGWPALNIRSAGARIVCRDTFENHDEIVDLVLVLVSQDILEVPVSEEFRYERFYRVLFPISLLGFSALVLASIGSMRFSEHPDGFYWEVFPIACFGFFALLALYGFIETREVFYIERDRLTSVRFGRRVEMPYAEIVGIERHRAWHGEERLFVSTDRARLKIAHQVERFDELARILDAIVPVRWRGEDAVKFPLNIRVRAWWLEPLSGVSMGIAMMIAGAYYGFDRIQDEANPWTVLFWLLLVIGSGILLFLGSRFGTFCSVQEVPTSTRIESQSVYSIVRDDTRRQKLDVLS